MTRHDLTILALATLTLCGCNLSDPDASRDLRAGTTSAPDMRVADMKPPADMTVADMRAASDLSAPDLSAPRDLVSHDADMRADMTSCDPGALCQAAGAACGVVDGLECDGAPVDCGVCDNYRSCVENNCIIPTLTTPMISSNTTPGGNFGHAIAVSGDLLAVSAPQLSPDNVGPSSRGTTFLYRWTGNGWSLEESLSGKNRDGTKIIGQGGALHLEQGFLVAGASSSENKGTLTGALVMHRTVSGGWEQTGTIEQVPSGILGAYQKQHLGASVLVTPDGDLLTGAPGQTVNDRGSAGTLKFYRASAGIGSWEQSSSFKATTPQKTGRFGASIAIAGDTLFVSEPGRLDETSTAAKARVHLYEKIDNRWSKTQTLELSAADIGSTESLRNDTGFGWVVLPVDDERVLITAPKIKLRSEDEHLSASLIYQRTGSEKEWTLAHTLHDPMSKDLLLGQSAAVSKGGRFIALGAPGASGDTGRVEIYIEENGVWKRLDTLTPKTAVGEQPRFGASLAFHGDMLIVGMPGKPGTETLDGQARVFDLGTLDLP